MINRLPALVVSGLLFAILLVLAVLAPEFLSGPNFDLADFGPSTVPPFGADDRGRPLWELAAQGARVVALPSVFAGALVGLFAAAGGLIRSMEWRGADSAIQAFGEVVGALPRMVVILIVALLLPRSMRGLFPLAATWAILSAPGAMDEAAAVAERLGGARFVEALRAHGFSSWRIFVVHVVGYNLRPVIVRQAAEVTMQVVFLEISLSYLATSNNDPSFTHPDSVRSWADILHLGYRALAFEAPFMHALFLGLALVALVAGTTIGLSRAARAR
jgi:ABC-type dipeptide/oligopeptide/nickel transport system permease subunit